MAIEPGRDISDYMRFFSYSHLPANLQTVSAPFCKLAAEVASRAPNSLQTLVSLQRLLEAKDAAVRAAIPDHVGRADVPPITQDPEKPCTS